MKAVYLSVRRIGEFLSAQSNINGKKGKFGLFATFDWKVKKRRKQNKSARCLKNRVSLWLDFDYIILV